MSKTWKDLPQNVEGSKKHTRIVPVRRDKAAEAKAVEEYKAALKRLNDLTDSEIDEIVENKYAET